MNDINDSTLNAIVRTLKNKYRCHTVLLYGSRARGQTTSTSDYDVIGVRRRGEKTRIAKKQNGHYWDVFVYSEKGLLKKPFKRHPLYEVRAIRAWAQKELDRCRAGDIQGLYRRAEFQNALIDHYFFIRQKRFWGPKEGFAWIKENDPSAFKLIYRSLKYPQNLSFLKAAALRVYKVELT